MREGYPPSKGRPRRLLIMLSCMLPIAVTLSCQSSDQSGVMIVDPNDETSSVTPLIDSNTNWLLSCSVDSDCDQGEQCACGSCVIPCSPSGEGVSLCMTMMGDPVSEVIECAEAEPVSEVSSCGEDYTRGHVGICLLGCATNEECPEHLLCHEGRCVRPRRGESRGCDDARACVEAGGSPDRCQILCEDERQEGVQTEREPPPPMREFLECERRCTEDGYTPETCRSRCAVCEERCPLIEDETEAEACMNRCERASTAEMR